MKHILTGIKATRSGTIYIDSTFVLRTKLVKRRNIHQEFFFGMGKGLIMESASRACLKGGGSFACPTYFFFTSFVRPLRGYKRKSFKDKSPALIGVMFDFLSASSLAFNQSPTSRGLPRRRLVFQHRLTKQPNDRLTENVRRKVLIKSGNMFIHFLPSLSPTQ